MKQEGSEGGVIVIVIVMRMTFAQSNSHIPTPCFFPLLNWPS
jgi:hypothetical protein